MTTSKPPVTIVGAGIVGICCGLTLQANGHPVTVIDPRPPGTGTSFGNAGIIGDSMILPISMPGLWKELPWMLFSRMSPMALRWQHLPRALPWLLRFLAESRTSVVRTRAAEINSLNSIATASHESLMRAHGVDRNLIRSNGVLELHRQRRPVSRLEQEIHAEHDIRCETIGPEELHQLEPGLAREFESAKFYPELGHAVQPITLSEAYAQAFRDRGGRFLSERVRGFELGADGPRRVITDLAIHAVDHLVIAAGAWSRRFARMLGTDVPLDTERGYHISVDWTDGVTLNRPVIDRDYYCYIVPMRDGVRVTSGTEMGGLDLAPDFRRIRRVLGQARHTVRGLDGEVHREWMGYRPSLPDSKPIIDRSANFPRVFFAFGHGHAGLTQSAATAALLSDLVAARTPRIDLGPFSAGRL